MDRECMECLRGMPQMHFHMEEFDWLGPTEVKAPKPTWEDLLADMTPKREPAKPKPKIARKYVSKSHSGMRIDGKNFVCDACGSESMDFDLFEEVGVEVTCKPVEEVEALDEEAKKEKAKKDLNDLYQKLLKEVKASEAAKISYKPMTTTFEHSAEPVVMHIDKPKPGEIARTHWVKQLEAKVNRERRKGKF